MKRRLKAIESRPTAQKPLRIVGGLPSGSEMIQLLAEGAVRAPKPLAPALADEHEPAPVNASTKAREPT